MTPQVFIVEDESLLVMVLEDMLPEIGYEVAATAHSVPSALQVLEANDPDLAILDVNLAGKPSFPVADALAIRGIPFLFASGYGESILPDRHANVPLVPKPYGRRELETALARLPPRRGMPSAGA
ncbi:response regulator [Luteimonas composti]|uniref:Response regulator n=1 Tax=Luteimonas composti TaxID=398257 RepID=A0ABT6MX78_9GAMM|nr:response regulator [Luteimonas composti]MDH7454736.1 response regulator [Luteimonas composti]